MCNLYSETKGQAAIRAAARAMRDLTGNLAPMPGIFPDYPAPIICTGDDGVRELVMARWGMPSPAQVIFEATSARADKMRARGGSVDFAQLLKIEPDKGVTNVRNLASSHWAPHLAPASRCLVPFTCFSEFNRDAGGDIWFASKRGSALVLLRWDFAAGLDRGAEDQDRRRDDRPVRLPDVQAECRGGGHPSQGHAGHPDRRLGA